MQKLVEALYRLPIGEQASISSSQMMSNKKIVSMVRKIYIILSYTSFYNRIITSVNLAMLNITMRKHS